jgi:hypothetical protein
MPRSASIPFVLVRSQQVVGKEITQTTENIHGLMHLADGRLRLQWRVLRATQRVGSEIRTDVELDPVAEVELPLQAIAGAEVRTKWWNRFGFPNGMELVLRAADMRAFEVVAGSAGLILAHPAELVIPVRNADSVNAREFAAELTLSLAELTEEDARLSSGKAGEKPRLK